MREGPIGILPLAYDPINQLIEVTDAMGKKTISEYDLVGRRISAAISRRELSVAVCRISIGTIISTDSIQPGVRSLGQTLKWPITHLD
jgi:YD repeat-containing protein